MRYKGQGNPLAVLVSCLTLGFLPTILLILGIIWIVQAIPIYIWILAAFLGLMLFIHKGIQGEKNEKQE